MSKAKLVLDFCSPLDLSRKFLFLFAEMLDLPLTVDQYISRIQELQAEMMPGAPLLPGVHDLCFSLCVFYSCVELV